MKKVKEYEGMLQEVGPSMDEGGVVCYTYIRIGSELIKNVHIYKRLHEFFLAQVGNANCKLWVARHPFRLLIVAIRQHDGQVYRIDLKGIYVCSAVLAITVGLLSYAGLYMLIFLLVCAAYPAWLIYSLVSQVRPIDADYEV